MGYSRTFLHITKRVLARIKASLLLGASAFFLVSAFPAASVYGAKCAEGADIGKLVSLGGGVSIGEAFGSLGEFLTAVVRLGLFAAALIFFAIIVWGGFRYLNAGGDRENVEGAKKTLTGAGIGLIIVVLALVGYQVVVQVFDLDRSSAARSGSPGTMRVSCDQQVGLEGKLPVRTAEYYIDYQKQNDIFVVTVQKEPVKENALKAAEWFKSNGVEDICDVKIGWTATMKIIKQGKLQRSDFPVCQQ